MPNAIDLTNQRFGRLVVQHLSHVNHYQKRCWACLCDCGNQVTVEGSNLKTGKTSSCGCLKREKLSGARVTHGASRSQHQGYARFPGAYKSWLAMRARCLNPGTAHYQNYGGRGICVHPDWLASYEAFVAYMGDRPAGTSLDRIDPNGNYEPGNVRWATQVEQARNTRSSHRVIVSGVTMSLADACDALGINRGSVRTIMHRTKQPAQDVLQDFISGRRKRQRAAQRLRRLPALRAGA